MKIDLTGYKQVGRDTVPYWYSKCDVYAFVFRKNPWVNLGFYNMRSIPLVYRNAVIDLLSIDECIFMIEKGE